MDEMGKTRKLGEIDSPKLAIGQWNGKRVQYIKRRIVVSLNDAEQLSEPEIEAAFADILTAVSGSTIIARETGDGVAVLEIPENLAVPETASDLNSRSDVEFAEPLFPVLGTAVPADPEFVKQWACPEVKLPAAWTIQQGTNKVAILVADSGLPLAGGVLNHTDLNSARITKIFDHVDGTFRDGHGHGTFMTGVIAATANNHIGIAGVNWHSPIYVSRVLDDHNINVDMGSYAIYAMFFAFMAWLKVNLRIVVNLSLIATENNVMKKMIVWGKKAGVLFCCGAGAVTSLEVEFPASMAAVSGNVVSVGSTDQTKTVVATPKGPPITVVAPGYQIYSTIPPYAVNGFPIGKYAYAGGNSTSTAIVSGVCSLIWSCPKSNTVNDVVGALKETAVPLNPAAPVPNHNWGYGIIDAHSAVNAMS